MNRPKAEKFNREAIEAISVREFTEMTAIAQRAIGLVVDGKCGPATRAALRRAIDGSYEVPRPVEDSGSELVIDPRGWLNGPGVVIRAADPSWFYPDLATSDGKPRAIVWHYTDTDPGTAEVMARRRMHPRTDDDRAASWHVSIEADGSIIQMVSLLCGAWHCRSTPEGRAVLRLPPNNCTASIELVGRGDNFPEPQVAAAARVARALVSTYLITRPKACLGHDQLDPERRRDPGPVWRAEHESRVLAHAYA